MKVFDDSDEFLANMDFADLVIFQNLNFAIDIQDEIEYELIVRRIDGGTAGTVLSMRKILRDLIPKENIGVLVAADSIKPDIHNEISICLFNVN
ncbi:hypothetical protein FQA39_LY01247 [Lamprigera yunnana]|nr:hypothetical protein FQA39_LY01247 [Lamprigera yunnana]